MPRDHLSRPLQRWERWLEEGTHPAAADRATTAQATTPSPQRQTRFVAPAVLIDQRPAAVEGRGRIGDWEGDLIVGRMSRSAIGALVERSSRYLRLIHRPHGHSAPQLRAVMVVALSGLAPQARLTLTWDQGSEMAHHHLLVEHFREGIFFARPASPWQRGTNENTNGLLRQYFPKGTDLSTHGLAALRAVQDRLNHRPRKTLGWRTPAELMGDLVAP